MKFLRRLLRRLLTRLVFTFILSLIFGFKVNYLIRIVQWLFLSARVTDAAPFPRFFAFDFSNALLYLVILLISLIVAARLIYLLSQKPKDILAAVKNENRFTTLNEIKKQYKAVSECDKPIKGRGGLIVARCKDKMYIDDTVVNNLILGTTRSGKGETLAIPMIDVYSRAEHQPSQIISDVKMELAKACIPKLKERGYDCYIYNLLDPNEGIGQNPFSLALNAYVDGDKETAQRLVHSFSYSLFHNENTKDPQWQTWAIALSDAIIMAHIIDCVKAGTLEKVNPYSVARMVADLGTIKVDKKTNALEQFIDERPDDDMAKLAYTSVKFTPSDKTQPTIYSQFISKYLEFCMEPVAKMTSYDSINLEKVGNGMRPVAIFLCVPDFDNSLNFLVSQFISQLYFILAKQATKNKSGKCVRQVVFHLDEFGNMHPIKAISEYITVSNGRNISFNLFVQSYEQIEEKYGKGKAETIISNCGNQMYILSASKNSAERFSSLLGTHKVILKSASGKGDKTSIGENIKDEPLLSSSDLMSFQEGENVIHRVLYRRSKKRKHIRTNPIHNHGKYGRFKFRYEYLQSFNPQNDIVLPRTTTKINLNNTIYQPDIFGEGQSAEQEYNDVYDKDLHSLLGKQQLTNLAVLLGIDGDYSRYTYNEFMKFLNELFEQSEITEEKVDDVIEFLRKNIKQITEDTQWMQDKYY